MFWLRRDGRVPLVSIMMVGLEVGSDPSPASASVLGAFAPCFTDTRVMICRPLANLNL